MFSDCYSLLNNISASNNFCCLDTLIVFSFYIYHSSLQSFDSIVLKFIKLFKNIDLPNWFKRACYNILHFSQLCNGSNNLSSSHVMIAL